MSAAMPPLTRIRRRMALPAHELYSLRPTLTPSCGVTVTSQAPPLDYLTCQGVCDYPWLYPSL